MDTQPTSELSRRQLLLAGGGVVAAATMAGASPVLADTAKKPAKLTQVRNATLLLDYAGTKFLIDPLFAEKGAFPGFPGSASSQFSNPLVPLPLAVAQLVDVDAVIVTHLHIDHWDEAAKAAIPRDKPLFAQNEDDAKSIRADGFTDVRVLSEKTEFNGVTLSRTDGQHGTDEALHALPLLGQVCGVVFSHPEFSTVYIAGDTVWNAHVDAAIKKHKPDVIVLNVGNAVIMGFAPIIMGLEDALAVHRAAPQATLVASHMEAINHCILSRATLRDFSLRQGFDKSLKIPDDGETLSI